jgi:pyruvate dehydrogenase E1 component beta subunit
MLEAHHLPSTDRILDAIARLQWDDEPDDRWLNPDGAHA